jgi:ATPase subunit of ABC transporter with duplicated ATPase domains
VIADIAGLDVQAGHRVVLRDIRLRLTAADRVLLGGGNGAGKTSLLRAMLPVLGGVHMLPTAERCWWSATTRSSPNGSG